MIKYQVLKTIAEMVPWGDMYEKMKIEEVNPMCKVEECIIQLNKEMEAAIVIHKEKKHNKILEDYVPKKLLEHNYRFFGTDRGGNPQPIHSW